MEGCAIFSDCGRFRYRLSRSWDGGVRNPAIFIMLNPSTADAERNDPTIRRCIGIARRLGCSGIEVVNLFAVRATLPRDMLAATDPVGPDNLHHIQQAIAYHNERPGLPEGPVVCAWGTHGGHLGQDEILMDWLAAYRPWCLGVTRHGFPRHPLYVRRDAVLRPYPGRAATAYETGLPAHGTSAVEWAPPQEMPGQGARLSGTQGHHASRALPGELAHEA